MWCSWNPNLKERTTEMSHHNFLVTHEGLTLHEILEELESAEDDRVQRLIYITPPDEGAETDIDSDKSDDEHEGNLNHLGRKILGAVCEVQKEYSGLSDSETSPTSMIQEITDRSESKPSSSTGELINNDVYSVVNSAICSPIKRPKRKINPPIVELQNDSEDEGMKETSTSSLHRNDAKHLKYRKRKAPAVVNVRGSHDPKPKKTKKEIAEEIKRAKIDQWKLDKPNFTMKIACDPLPCSDDAMECETPLDFFSLFFNDELLDHICEQSNLYASQKNVELNLTKDELWVFFGGLLMSGYAKYPNKRMNWSTEDDVPKILAQSMRCNRFEQILRFLHLNDNTEHDRTDKLFKLRPYVEGLNASFKKHGGLDENISVDESMIPYYGKHYAKQFIKGKPIRFGFKNWALCSSSGYLLAFEIYMGKDKDQETKFGLGGDVVVRLIENAEISGNNGHKVYIDNFFTSVPLIRFLSEAGICATGTIQENRTELCPLKTRKELAKEERGSFDFRTSENIMLVRWHDNSVCTIATNCENFSIGTARRWSKAKKAKVQVSQPTVFSSYNKHMGGVDLMDQNVAAYRTRMRQKKWWWPIFVYLFDVTVSNSWLLSRKLLPPGQAIGQLLKFRRELALTLLKRYGKASNQGKSTPKPSSDIRYDGSNHWPLQNPTERRCGNCTGKAKFICVKCNIGLHPKCFMDYHIKK